MLELWRVTVAAQGIKVYHWHGINAVDATAERGLFP